VAAPLHQGPTMACAFVGPDRLATGSVEGRILIWDWRAGRVELVIEAHAGPVGALTAGRDSLISAGHDGRILVHGLDGERRVELCEGAGGVMALALSPDGALLASGGYDRVVRLWRLDDGTCIARLVGHEGAVTSLDFLHDGRLASGARDDTVRVWDVRAGRQLAVGRGCARWVTRVRAIGETILTVSEDGTFRAWDAASGEERWRCEPAGPRPIWGLACSPDGRVALVGAGGGVFRCEIGPEGIAAFAEISPLTARAMAAHGETFALGADEPKVLVLEPGREAVTLETGALGDLSIAAFRDPRSRVLHTVIGQADGGVHHDDGDVRRPLAPAHERFTYAAARVGFNRFATGAFDGMARLWRIVDGEAMGVLAHGGFIFSLSASADGSRLLVGGSTMLSLWETATGRELWRVQTPGAGFHNFAALSPNGREVVAVGEDPWLRRWTLSADGQRVDGEGRVRHGLRLVTAIASLPEPDAAVAGTADGQILRLDLKSGGAEVLHAAHEDWVRNLVVSPDGRRVLSVSQHGVAAVFDVASRRLETPAAMRGRYAPAATFAQSGEIVFVDGLGGLHVVAAPEFA
jgi:WD40 repeat protein